MSLFRKIIVAALVAVAASGLSLSAQVFAAIFPSGQVGTNTGGGAPFTRDFYLHYLNDQPDFVQVGIDFSAYGFDFLLRYDMKQNIKGAMHGSSYTNWMTDGSGFLNLAGFNSAFPSTSYVGYHNDFVDISVGRRKLGEGFSPNSFMLDSSEPALDAIYIYANPLKKLFAVRPYFLLMGSDSSKRANRIFLSDPTNSPKTPSGENLYSTDTKWYFLHKIGIETDFFRVGMSESLLVYGTDLSFALLDPTIMWHNSYLTNHVNSALSFTFEAKIADAWRVYGEAMMDDVYLGATDAAAKPTAVGFSLGGEFQIFKADTPYIGPLFSDDDLAKKEPSYAKTDGLVVGLDAFYASRYLYSRGIDDPFGKMTYLTTLQYGKNEKWPVIETYYGLPYGPGSAMARARVIYKTGRWNVAGSLGYLAKQPGGSGVYEDGALAAQDLVPAGAASDIGAAFRFSGPVTHNILVDVNAYYAFNSNIVAYIGTSNKVAVNKMSATTAYFNVGAALKFNTDQWFINKFKETPAAATPVSDTGVTR